MKTIVKTIADCIRGAEALLAGSAVFFGHGTDNAWDDAVQIILHVMGIPLDVQDDVSAHLVSADQWDVIQALLHRRIEERIPVPYLIGEAWFAGLPFAVDQRVLIPRSPMAELVENAFAPWLVAMPQRVLDLCCGSGCIGIAISQVFPGAQVDMVDISADALSVAQDNIERHNVQDRVNLLQSDVMDSVTACYDIIISNPPYVDAVDMAALPREYRHEPALALAAGVDGLDIVRRILATAGDHLTGNGILVVEVGNGREALERAYPQVPFLWLALEGDEDGVFLLTMQDLTEHRQHFHL